MPVNDTAANFRGDYPGNSWDNKTHSLSPAMWLHCKLGKGSTSAMPRMFSSRQAWCCMVWRRFKPLSVWTCRRNDCKRWCILQRWHIGDCPTYCEFGDVGKKQWCDVDRSESGTNTLFGHFRLRRACFCWRIFPVAL